MRSETTESAGYYELVTWVMLNRKRVIAAAIAVLALGCGIGVARWYSKQHETNANKALFDLHASPDRDPTVAAPKADAYLKVAEDYAGTSAGERALVLAAGGLYTEGKFAEAAAQFDRFRQVYADSALGPVALYGTAASLDAQSKTNEALTAYKDVVSRYPNSGVATQAKLASAAIHENRNQPDEALKIYDELNRPSAPTLYSSEVSSRRERLLAKNPQLNVELARTTNAPKVTLTRIPSTNAANTNLPKIQIQAPTPGK